MEFHILAEPQDIARYVLIPGSQSRAKLIADHFEDRRIVSEERGIVVYSGFYRGLHITSCGSGMGGPAMAIAAEELGHLGADTFIRLGSCGVFQSDQKPGDIIIANGVVRGGGTGCAYLPIEYPATPTFEMTRSLVDAALTLNIPVQVGVGVAADAFYAPIDQSSFQQIQRGKPLFIEMESDTLFVVGAVRGWRTAALFVSDGSPGEIKPAWGKPAFERGIEQAIKIALTALSSIAKKDEKK